VLLINAVCSISLSVCLSEIEWPPPFVFVSLRHLLWFFNLKNRCNKLEKKSYYTIFQLSGFSSFDGQWSD